MKGRDRAESKLALLDAPTARAILVRVYEPVKTSRRSSPFYGARMWQWSAAAVHASSCLALHGDAADCPEIATALAWLARYEGRVTTQVLDLRRSLALLVTKTWPAPVVRELAGHPAPQVRRAVAEGLASLAKEGEAAALVAQLAADPYTTVRFAARASATKGALEPWHGIFSSDPTEAAVAWAREKHAGDTAKMAGAEKKARALLSALYETFVKEPWDVEDEEPALASRCALLPDALVVDLARRVGSFTPRGGASPIVAAAATREGGAELLLELVFRWLGEGKRYVDDLPSKVLVGPAYADVRKRVGEAAAREALSSTRTQKERELASSLALKLLDREAVAAWLVTAAHACPSHVAYGAADVLIHDGRAPEPIVAWARRALGSGEAFASSGLRHLATKVAATLPADDRRSLAEPLTRARENEVARAAPDDDDDDADPARSWALAELLVRAYDEAKSGPRRALAESLFAVPANRRCFLSSPVLVPYVLPAARAALRRGELAFSEARMVACAVRSFANGSTRGSVVDLDDDERLVMEAMLAPEEERADLDESELAIYFEARSRHTFEGAGVALADFDVVGREGPHAEALVAALVAAAVANQPEAIVRLRHELYFIPTPLVLSAVRAAFPDDDELAPVPDSILYPMEHAADTLGEKTSRRSREKLLPGMVAREADMLLSAKQVRALLSRAIDALDDGTDASPVLFAHRCSAIAFAAAASVLHGDPRAMGKLAEVLEWQLDDGAYVSLLHACLGDLVALSSSGDKAVRELAKSHLAVVRLAVAHGLRADEPAARAMLMELVADGDIDVRDAARKALGEGAVPWWTGVFGRDPTEALSDDEATKLAPVLAAIAAALGPLPEGERREELTNAEVERLSKKLPAALACDLARQQAKDLDGVMGLSPWVVAALPREGGDELLEALLALTPRHRSLYLHGLVEAVAQLPAKTQSTFALRAIRFAAYEAEGDPGLLLMVVKLLKKTDASAVADELVAIATTDEAAFEATCSSFHRWFDDQKVVPEQLVAWAFAQLAKEADDSERCTERFARMLVVKAPRERARAAALAALEGRASGRKRWALEQLFGKLYVPTVDGPKGPRARAFYEDPSYRHLMLSSDALREHVLPFARVDLRDGKLAFEEAHLVATTVYRAHGTAAEAATETVTRPGAKRAAPSRSGLTEAERDAYLAVREGFRFEGKGWHLFDHDLIGTSTELGKAHLAASIAAVENGDEEAAQGLAYALYAYPDDALLDAGMAMARVYADSGLPEFLRMSIERAHTKLSRPLEEPLPRRRGEG